MPKAPRASGSSSVSSAGTAVLVHSKAALDAFEDPMDSMSLQWPHNDFQHMCWSGCEEDGYHTCSFIGCSHQTKQRMNMKTHELHHFDIKFPCEYATQGRLFQSADPAAHSKHLHIVHRRSPTSRSSKSSSSASAKRSRKSRRREMNTSWGEESSTELFSTASSITPSSWSSRSPSPSDFSVTEFYQCHDNTIPPSLPPSSYLIDSLANEDALLHSSLADIPSLCCLSTVSPLGKGDHVSLDRAEWLASELTPVQHTLSCPSVFYDVYSLSLD